MARVQAQPALCHAPWPDDLHDVHCTEPAGHAGAHTHDDHGWFVWYDEPVS